MTETALATSPAQSDRSRWAARYALCPGVLAIVRWLPFINTPPHGP